MDLYAPTILLPRVRVPSTVSTLLPFIVQFVLYLSCEKNEIKQKEAGFGPLKKQICTTLALEPMSKKFFEALLCCAEIKHDETGNQSALFQYRIVTLL